MESISGNFDSSDPIMNDVINMIKNMDRVSTSLIQRRFKIGYNRAARILDALEEQGYVGPLEGARGRKVINTKRTGSLNCLKTLLPFRKLDPPLREDLKHLLCFATLLPKANMKSEELR